jgi:DNA polymerase-3 subunit delta
MQELEKLVLFCGKGNEITAEAVDLLAGGRGPAQSQSLPEALGTGAPSTVLQVFEDRVPKGSYLPLTLADLARHLRQLLLLQSRRARDSREASQVLWSARLPAPQPLIPELLRQARNLPPRHLIWSLQAVLRAEVELRSSPADDRLVVERLLLEISAPLRRASDVASKADHPSSLYPAL